MSLYRLAPFVPLLALALPACAMDASSISTVPPTNAQCYGADGTTQKFAATEDAYLDLAGAWDSCTSTLTDIPSNVVGIDFTGRMAVFLVPGPNGTTVQGSGTAYQRSVQVRIDAQGLVIILADTDGSYASYAAEITAAPHRIRLENTTTHEYIVLGARTR